MQRPSKDGEVAQKKERITVGTGQAAGLQIEEKKGGMGGWRVSEAPSSSRRAQEARGWGPGAGCAKAEGIPG